MARFTAAPLARSNRRHLLKIKEIKGSFMDYELLALAEFATSRAGVTSIMLFALKS